MAEGSGTGSGSIYLTNGSGCGSGTGRPENIWILWIRIRNTAVKIYLCFVWTEPAGDDPARAAVGWRGGRDPWYAARGGTAARGRTRLRAHCQPRPALTRHTHVNAPDQRYYSPASGTAHYGVPNAPKWHSGSFLTLRQCFRSVSGLDPNSVIKWTAIIMSKNYIRITELLSVFTVPQHYCPTLIPA
jgi:hypothetical protein